MNIAQLEGSWDALKGKLKQRYGQLTDDDLTFIEGKGEELCARLQNKLGISRSELDTTLDELAGSAVGVLKEAKKKPAGLAEEARAKASEAVEDLKQRTAALTEEAKARGAAAYGGARQRARGLWAEGEDYVRANPRESLLGAMIAGFVTALIVFRR